MTDTPTLSPQDSPDLEQGVAVDRVADGAMLLGHVRDAAVILVRKADEWFAVGAKCTHYGGHLAEGRLVDDTIRCPLHHACFSLRTGEALRAPAFDSVPCWRVERQGDHVFVREKLPPPRRTVGSARQTARPASVVIIGGGAAGFAAAEMLRREEYEGPVTIFTGDEDLPVDRPNLSKDYLAGEAQEDWLPLWPPETYVEHQIDVNVRARVTSIDPAARTVALEDGSTHAFGALLLATGAEAIRLPIPMTGGASVFTLRSYGDARAIVAQAGTVKRVVVVGASFIGLEVAASLRTRGIEVDVVAPDAVPLERVMGLELGRFVLSLHEDKGVRFHLGRTVTAIDGQTVTLSDGGTLDADCVVMGVGVRPLTGLAERAGLAIDRGVLVDEYLETSVPGIFAAGDVARWPDPHTGVRIRVEHWVVAQRQGQVAARNILGRRERFEAVPFFWSRHYDVTIDYVGHAEQWDTVRMDGIPAAGGCTATFVKGGRTLAVATVARPRESLDAEVQLEHTTP